MAAGEDEGEGAALAVYTLEEVAQHRTRQSCWVALHEYVYDFTQFVESHPGGARGILRHAGTDASEVFAELHSQSIFAAFGPTYRIGKLATPSTVTAAWRGVPDSDDRSRTGLLAAGGLEAVSPTTGVLPSAFPHDAFTGTGLETFRFHWAVADRLLRKDVVGGGGGEHSVPPAPGVSTQHVHRQKSNLGVLDHDRDWLHVGEPRIYAAEMTLKRTLLLEHADSVYVTEPMALAAESETLSMALEFLERRYPDRFEFHRATPDQAPHRVTTLTPGYLHSFLLSEWESAPLRLLGMLIQEDCYLLEEMDVEEDLFDSPLPGTDDFTRPNIAEPGGYSREDHVEDHPTGKQHVFLAACSCFSFDAVPRHKKPMSAIHHPNVPGWYFHLQRGMNRLFTDMEPEMSWYRHTQDLQFSGLPEHVLAQEPGRPLEAFTGPFTHLVYGAEAQEMDTIARTEIDEVEGRGDKAAEQQQHEKEHEEGEGVELDDNGRRVRRNLKPQWERLREEGADYIRNEMLFSLEFQTLRRLPRTRYILFTVRRYVDPMGNLERWPAAAAALAGAIRRKYKGTVARSALGEKENSAPLLEWLDQVATEAGLEPGLKGVVAEPWERAALIDGTSAPAKDEELRAALRKTAAAL
jgi:hypothetical protein